MEESKTKGTPEGKPIQKSAPATSSTTGKVTPAPTVAVKPTVVVRRVEEPKIEEFKFDTNTVIYIIYLMYKNNMITRRHIKDLFAIVKQDVPSDVTKWLVEEASKSA